MITIDQVQLVLRGAGKPESTQKLVQHPNRVATLPGFTVYEQDNRVHVGWVLGPGADSWLPQWRRQSLREELEQLERLLSRVGYTVTLFSPDAGERFRLTLEK